MQADFDGPGPEVMWRTDRQPRGVQGLWSALAAAFPRTGLWPVALEGSIPQLELNVAGDRADQTARDPEEVLASLWASSVPEDEDAAELVAPFGDAFPGLAPGGAERIDVAVPGTLGALDGIEAIAVVPVTRPADVVAAIGWQGPVNLTNDVASLSAVMRSWEERYDAILVGLGFDTLYVAVRRPPRGEAACLAAAAELYAFCPDLVQQGAGSLRALAAELDGSEGWAFWWD